MNWKEKLPGDAGAPESKRGASEVTLCVPTQAHVTVVPTVTVRNLGDQVRPASTIIAVGTRVGVELLVAVEVGVGVDVRVDVPELAGLTVLLGVAVNVELGLMVEVKVVVLTRVELSVTLGVAVVAAMTKT